MSTILLPILLFNSLILIHELGHFIAAKLAGVPVKELGLFWPPRLIAFRRGGIEYSLNLLPLGGFVRFEGGESDPSVPDSLAGRSIPVRVLVISAGAIMNLLLAFVIFTAVAATPIETRQATLTVLAVEPGSPAAMAGLLAGDQIEAVDDSIVRSTGELIGRIEQRKIETVQLFVRRSEALRLIPITLQDEAPTARMHLGIQLSANPVVITGIAPDSPADEAGLQKEDAISSIEGMKVQSALDLSEKTHQYLGQRMYLTIVRDGSERRVSITPREEPPEGEGPLGVMISEGNLVTYNRPLWEAPIIGFRQGIGILAQVNQEVGNWVRGKSQPQLAGPIGIAQMTHQVADFGLRPLFLFAGFLSLNLGILNLLPIPMLDGGRLLFIAIEIARGGRRIPPQKEAMIHVVGLSLLLALVLVVSYFDILRLLG